LDPQYQCSCEEKFYTSIFLNGHVQGKHKRHEIGLFFATLKAKETSDKQNSQDTDSSSEGIITSQDLKLFKLIQAEQQTTFITYLVLIVDREAIEIGLKAYLRKHHKNGQRLVLVYAGKQTVYNSNGVHDIWKDHVGRGLGENNCSAIVAACAHNNKVAYEVKRVRHETRDEMEAHEAWFQLFLKYRNAKPKNPNRLQWCGINERFEKVGVKSLTKKDIHDAYSLGSGDIPVICLTENCEETHNSKAQRKYYLKLHCEESEINLLSGFN